MKTVIVVFMSIVGLVSVSLHAKLTAKPEEIVAEFRQKLEASYPGLETISSDKRGASHPIQLHGELDNHFLLLQRKHQEEEVIVPLLKAVRKSIGSDVIKGILRQKYGDDASLFLEALSRGDLLNGLKMSQASAEAIEEADELKKLCQELGKVVLRKMDELSLAGFDSLATRLTIGELMMFPANKILVLGGADMSEGDAKKNLRKSLSDEVLEPRGGKGELLIPEFRDPVRKLLISRDLRLKNGGRMLADKFGNLYVGMKGGVLKSGIKSQLLQLLGERNTKELLDAFPGELIRPSQFSAEALSKVLPESAKGDLATVSKIFEEKSSKAGKVMFLGGASGAGKSSGLRKVDFDDKDAISPDPIKAFFVSKSNPARVNMSSGQLHANASAINGVLKEIVNKDYSRNYVADATLADLDDVMDSLAAGKKTVIEFHIVPPEMSFLRVLSRDPGGNDPTLPMARLEDIYRGTLESLGKLEDMTASGEWENQLRVNYYGPNFLGGEIGENPTKANLPWTREEAAERGKLFKQRLVTLASTNPTIKSLLGDGVTKPYFMSNSELELTRKNKFVLEYLEMPIREALEKHSLRTK